MEPFCNYLRETYYVGWIIREPFFSGWTIVSEPSWQEWLWSSVPVTGSTAFITVMMIPNFARNASTCPCWSFQNDENGTEYFLLNWWLDCYIYEMRAEVWLCTSRPFTSIALKTHSFVASAFFISASSAKFLIRLHNENFNNRTSDAERN